MMDTGDAILSLITFLFFVFLFINPYLRKLTREAEKAEADEEAAQKRPSAEYRADEEVSEQTPGPVPAVSVRQELPREMKSLVSASPSSGPVERIEKLSPLKRAFLWSEIIPGSPYEKDRRGFE